jgi:hypothetical protein
MKVTQGVQADDVREGASPVYGKPPFPFIRQGRLLLVTSGTPPSVLYIYGP